MTEAFVDFPAYTAGYGLSNGHIQTIFPHLMRRVDVPFQRSQLELPDGDFLTLDTLAQADRSAPWLVVSHGMEGSSRAHYIQGLAKYFYQAGWSVQAWNFRSCGGSMNRLPRLYHSGTVDDLNSVIEHVVSQHQAEQIFLAGFSMGGNQTLLALADPNLAAQVVGGVGFSVPLDLTSCAEELAKPAQRIYMKRFLKDLKVKIEHKARQFPKLVSSTGFDEIQTFHQFDERYTAPLHGFDSAADYWQRCSSKPALSQLQRPTLVVNADNDPFLSRQSKDCRCLERCKHLQLEIPMSGGHVGFARWRINKPLWTEMRALSFAQSLLQRNH
ncbi:YheT family hydrolase [Reinekea thalattae]|uniref:YheT family hydrolase n=1 Tax=Reinekea thalattae TaxID=2593301 RepID=UPI001C9C8F2A|nr:alpha/beta fold hydrolase [Reinekea thalattae]